MTNIDKIHELVLLLATDDYQNRDGDYPESGVADTIQVDKVNISFDFKNTSCSTAKRWVRRFLEDNNLYVDEDDIEAWQDGDYQDDWVVASVMLKNIKFI